MKKIIVFVVTIISVVAINNLFAEEPSTKDENREKIYNFYYKYRTAFDQPVVGRFGEICDSLMSIYCTQELCNIMKDDRVNGVGYDFMTDNYWMDDLSLKTLKVTAQENYYIVSYQVMIEDYNCKTLTNVKLQVEMGDGKICRVAPVGKKAAYE